MLQILRRSGWKGSRCRIKTLLLRLRTNDPLYTHANGRGSSSSPPSAPPPPPTSSYAPRPAWMMIISNKLVALSLSLSLFVCIQSSSADHKTSPDPNETNYIAFSFVFFASWRAHNKNKASDRTQISGQQLTDFRRNRLPIYFSCLQFRKITFPWWFQTIHHSAPLIAFNIFLPVCTCWCCTSCTSEGCIRRQGRVFPHFLLLSTPAVISQILLLFRIWKKKKKAKSGPQHATGNPPPKEPAGSFFLFKKRNLWIELK